MTSSKSNSFSDPDQAMRFRGILRKIVTSLIDQLRPEPQYGLVLNIYRGGAEFRIGSADIPEGPPPEGIGNPRQVYYATVRLDTGEVVTARVHENIPVFRPASYYDATSNEGSTEPYLIAMDAYRRRTVVPRTDSSGNTYDSVEPEMAHMSSPPFVPPRVMIEGHAGRYVLTRIIRGMVRMENVVLDSPIQVNGASYYNHVIDSADPSTTELRPVYTEYTTQYQGFIGDSGWNGEGTFEVEIANGARYQRFVFSTLDISFTEWNNWYVVPATYATSGHKDVGFPADESNQALFAYLDSTGTLFLYVATRALDGVSTEPDLFLGGSVRLRAINRALTQKPDVIFPSDPIVAPVMGVWGRARLKPVITSVIDYAPVGSVSPFTANLRHLQLSLMGGGVKKVTLSADGTKTYFNWSKRFLVMTAKTPTMPNAIANIERPPNGSEIAVVGGLATDGSPLPTRTVTSQGIDITGWCGLYYALPLNGQDASMPGNFVIVQYTGWFDIPDHWILIARHVAELEHSRVLLGSGQEVDLWRKWDDNVSGLSIFSGYEPAVHKVNNIVFFSGGYNIDSSISGNEQSTNSPIPLGYRPFQRFRGMALCIPSSGEPFDSRFDVFEDGNVRYGRAMSSGGSIFFDSISYPAGN